MAIKKYCADTDFHLIHVPTCPDMSETGYYVEIRSKLALESFFALGFKKHSCMINENVDELPDIEEYPFPDLV